MKENVFLEKHTAHTGLYMGYSKKLHEAKSQFQHMEVYESPDFGRVMVLDGCVMLTDRDEFVYHEMITHPALSSHPNPESVLIVGGGDGGSVRECLKHETVRKIHLVEIDEMVVEVSREFFPALTVGLDDPRVKIIITDGFDHVEKHPQAYDVILVDSVDPVGEAAKLFSASFYGKCKAALKPGGILVAQSDSPFYHADTLNSVVRHLKNHFAHIRPYTAFIPTYPAGYWSFTSASDAIDLKTAPQRKNMPFLNDLKYFNPELLAGALVPPNFLKKVFKGEA